MNDPLCYSHYLKTPVEKKEEAIQIVLGIFVEIEGMKSAAETCFPVFQQDVNPAKLGQIIGMTPGLPKSMLRPCSAEAQRLPAPASP